MAQINFNAAQVDPTNEFEILPAGDYPIIIVDSVMKPTKDGRGQYLQLTEEVIEGPYQGRKFWDRLNLDNPNQQAVEIAQRTLSQICHAIGVLQVQDSAQLHDRPLIAKLKVRPARGQYSESNEVAQYKPMAQPAGGATQPGAYQAPQHQPTPAQAVVPPQQPTHPAAAAVPPWQR